MSKEISKHVIEIEVEVQWDDTLATSDVYIQEYPHYMRVTKHRWTVEELKLKGITRPKPPYEPQLGDIVRLDQGSQFFQVANLHADGCIDLVDANNSIIVKRLDPDLVIFVARPF
jgi:hypothetical protein